jgi:membrane protease subunit HflC
MRTALLLLLLALAVAIGLSVLGRGPFVVTREGQFKIALFLGDPIAVITEPGIDVTLPLVDTRSFDSRWQHLGSERKEIPTSDQERVVIDNYVIWRISDPLLFYKKFPTGMTEAETQINQQVRGKVREVIGRRSLAEVLKDARGEIMREMTEKSAEAVKDFGIELKDVRINRTELPEGTEENVFARMREERNRLARKYRAEGEEQARRIRADSDREARVVVAEARGQAEIERGQGDAEVTRIYAEAYSEDAEFYGFLRGLEAYRKTIGTGTTMVLAPDHEFFRLLSLGSERGSPGSSESPESSE